MARKHKTRTTPAPLDANADAALVAIAAAATPAPLPVAPPPATLEPDAGLEALQALANDDPDGVGGWEPTERSIVKRKYRREYAKNQRSNGDRLALDLRAFLFHEDGETLDYGRLVRLAKANECWRDEYKALNPGQVRMNVGNRLRARERKGHAIVWAE